MILGLTPLVFVHTLISLAAIVAGFLAVLPLLGGRVEARPTVLFLGLTVAMVLTGFLIPPAAPPPSPPQIFGILTTLLLIAAGYALYAQRLVGRWAAVYAGSAVLMLYLNVFVLIVQAFQKLPPLTALAPTQTETPFVVAQAAALVAWLAATTLALLRSRRMMPTFTQRPMA